MTAMPSNRWATSRGSSAQGTATSWPAPGFGLDAMHAPLTTTTSPPFYAYLPPSIDLGWAYMPIEGQGREEAKLQAAAQREARLASAHPPPPHLQPHLHHPILSPHEYLPGNMAAPPTDQELAELQRLSDNYEAEATGPLVGQRQESSNITTEYASADPVLQAKTAALPQKYSHYRTMRGDGRCGWRAVAFGYFEALIRLGDSNKFTDEEGRLRSLENIVSDAGFDLGLYEDFSDETFDLLHKLCDALTTGTGDHILLDTFNDEQVQNYIIVHLKTLTSAWMITHEEDYAGFLVDQTVKDFTDKQVMPVGSEIDNVALTALNEVFLYPTGIALHVLYLDRTEGSEVNLHSITEDNNGGVSASTVRLLYRPGHYDLLYLREDLQTVQPVPTYFQFDSAPLHNMCTDIGGSDLLATIPGISHASNWLSGFGLDNGSAQVGCTVPRQQYSAMPSALPSPASTQPLSSFSPASLPQSDYAMPDLAFRDMTCSSSHLPALPDQMPTPFRPSAWELKQGFVRASQKPLQTSIFQNSYYNTAHFLNPDFQPEEWRPSNEACVKAQRHRYSC